MIFIGCFFSFGQVTESQSQASIYDVNIRSIYGDDIDLSQYKGKKILFVNVASNCGFTGQYKELEELHQQYKDKLVVIGVPCNQFGGQEPGDNEEIVQFCKQNYGVSFLLTESLINQVLPTFLTFKILEVESMCPCK